MKPSELLSVLETQPILTPVAFDTETSGLYPDDGARVATVSVAWADVDGSWERLNREHGWGLTIEEETLIPGREETVVIVSTAWPFDQGVAGTGKPEDHGQTTLWGEAENLDFIEWAALCDFLTKMGKQRIAHEGGLVAHNAKFDCYMMKVGTRLWPLGVELIDDIIWDTQNGMSLLFPLMHDPKTGKVTTSLKPSCSVLFKAEFADEKKKVDAYLKKARLPVGRWDLMPWDVIGDYADLDARITLLLYYRQMWEIWYNHAGEWLYPSVATNGNEVAGPTAVLMYAMRRLRITRLLYHMEQRGLPYDEAASMEAALECETRAEKFAKQLPFKPTLVAAKEYYFGSGTTETGEKCLDLVPYAVTDAGSPQMTEEIVDRMLIDGLPHIAEWAQLQKVQNAESMWYRGYANAVGPDGRLRTSFRQNGTRSHRFSVERVNLQAIPQDFRLSGFPVLEGIPTPRQLVAQAVRNGLPGWTLWELDLAQAELRVAAWLARCKKMLDMIEANEDLHTYTTKELFDKDPSDLDFGKYRQVGKRGNFSLIFGSGADTFSKMVAKETGIRLSPAQATTIVTDWNRLYPEFGRAIDKHMDIVALRQTRYGKGWITLLNGERRWFEKNEDAHKAFNQRVQPNLAQFGLDWMLESEQILTDAGFGDHNQAGLLLTIHDSQVILTTNDDRGRNALNQCIEAGNSLWSKWFDVPGQVDAKAWS